MEQILEEREGQEGQDRPGQRRAAIRRGLHVEGALPGMRGVAAPEHDSEREQVAHGKENRDREEDPPRRPVAAPVEGKPQDAERDRGEDEAVEEPSPTPAPMLPFTWSPTRCAHQRGRNAAPRNPTPIRNTIAQIATSRRLAQTSRQERDDFDALTMP